MNDEFDTALAMLGDGEGEEQQLGGDDGDETVVEIKPKEEEPVKPKEEETAQETPRVSKALAKLARREASLLERESKTTAMADEAGKLQARFAELQTIAKSDPLRFLEEAGVDMDLLTKQLVHGEPPKKTDPEIAELRKSLEELKAKSSKADEQSEAYQQRMRELAIKREHEEIAAHVPKAGGFVAALAPEEATAAIFEIKREHWRKTKNVLDTVSASGMLEERLGAQYQRLAKAAQNAQPATPPAAGATTRTLGQSHGSRTTRTPEQMSDEERITHALEMLKRAGSDDE